MSHQDFGKAGYSQQYDYSQTLQSVQSNSGHDMSKQVSAGQPGMYSNSGGMQSATQHHHQQGMARPAPSHQLQWLVQQRQQMGRTHMPIPEQTDSEICMQFATQVAQALTRSHKSESSTKSSAIEGQRIVQPVVSLCLVDIETENKDACNTVDISEQHTDNTSIPGTNESLAYYKQDTDLSSVPYLLEAPFSTFKLQEKPSTKSKKNKTRKEKDLNKRYKRIKDSEMEVFGNWGEEISLITSPVPTLPNPVTAAPPPVKQHTASPIPTIVDSNFLNPIPLPGEIIEPLPKDISHCESSPLLNEVESAAVSPANMQFKKNKKKRRKKPDKTKCKTFEYANTLSKRVFEYTYKEADQCRPLNPEGKKQQYSREFLLQMQSVPLSLCKPSNFPKLDIIKNKAHIHRLPEVNWPPDLTVNRCIQQRGDKKTRKISAVSITNMNIKLHESENDRKPHFHKTYDQTTEENIETQELYRQVRDVLNKLTLQKFETLVQQVKNFDINTEKKLNRVVDLVYETAISQINFSFLYANMCKQLALIKVPLDGQPGQQINFSELLLTKCQKMLGQDSCDELKRDESLKAIESAEPDKRKELQVVFDEKERKLRYRKLGNIRFIGELFKLNMIIDPIMNDCINKLLNQGDKESLECLCKLLKSIGKELEDNEKNQGTSHLVEQYFAQMQKIIDRHPKSSRIRFMFQDVIDLKRSHWVPRRSETDPKTIDQIRKEAAEEANEKLLKQKQNLSAFFKRMSDNERKTAEINMGVTEDGWTPTSKSNKESFSMVDPSKLKLTKPDEVESIHLGPCERGLSSWGQGNSGGNTTPAELDVKTALTNRSAAQSLESSGGCDSQLSPVIRKMTSTSRERENLIETINELNSIVEKKPQEVDKINENQLNGKAAESTALILKGPCYSEYDIDKKTKPIIDNFLRSADYEKTIKCVADLASPSTVHFFIDSAINYVLIRSNQDRNLLGQLLYALVKKELITINQIKKGLNGVLEDKNMYALRFPLIWEYVGEILEPLIGENKLPLTILKDILEPCIPSKNAGKLVSSVLSCAAKKKIGELWRESGLQWTDFLDSSTNIPDFIHSHKLDFPVSPSKAVPNDQHMKLLTDEIQTQLKHLLESTDENENIFDWIDARLDLDTVAEPSFIRALVTAVHVDAISGVGLQYNLDQFKLRKRIPLLCRYIGKNENLELQALYAVQQLVNDIGQPKGVLRYIFDTLYDDDIITEETFKQWEQSENPNEQEGKSVALLSVNGFFKWLREAESD